MIAEDEIGVWRNRWVGLTIEGEHWGLDIVCYTFWVRCWFAIDDDGPWLISPGISWNPNCPLDDESVTDMSDDDISSFDRETPVVSARILDYISTDKERYHRTSTNIIFYDSCLEAIRIFRLIDPERRILGILWWDSTDDSWIDWRKHLSGRCLRWLGNLLDWLGGFGHRKYDHWLIWSFSFSLRRLMRTWEQKERNRENDKRNSRVHREKEIVIRVYRKAQKGEKNYCAKIVYKKKILALTLKRFFVVLAGKKQIQLQIHKCVLFYISKNNTTSSTV